MSSLDALKYKIIVGPSFYAGILIFLLYAVVLSLAMFITPLSLISSVFYLILLLSALVAAKKAYQQSCEFKVSESGLLERDINNVSFYGKINPGSFYNGFMIFLKLEMKTNSLSDSTTSQYITIYKDAVTKEQYRLIARLINSGRD